MTKEGQGLKVVLAGDQLYDWFLARGDGGVFVNASRPPAAGPEGFGS